MYFVLTEEMFRELQAAALRVCQEVHLMMNRPTSVYPEAVKDAMQTLDEILTIDSFTYPPKRKR